MPRELRERPSQSLRAREAQGDYEPPQSRQNRHSTQASLLSDRIKSYSKPYNPNLPPAAFPSLDPGAPRPTEPGPTQDATETSEPPSPEGSDIDVSEEKATDTSNSNQAEMAKEPVNSTSEDASGATEAAGASIISQAKKAKEPVNSAPTGAAGVTKETVTIDKKRKAKEIPLDIGSTGVATRSSKTKPIKNAKQGISISSKSTTATISQDQGDSGEMPVKSIEKPDVPSISSSLNRISIDPEDPVHHTSETSHPRYRRVNSEPAQHIANPLPRVRIASIKEIGWEMITPALQWAIFYSLIAPPGASHTTTNPKVIGDAANKLGLIRSQIEDLFEKNDSSVVQHRSDLYELTSPEPGTADAAEPQRRLRLVDQHPNDAQLDRARQFLLERGLDASLLGEWERIDSPRDLSPAQRPATAQSSAAGPSGTKQAMPKTETKDIEISGTSGGKRKRAARVEKKDKPAAKKNTKTAAKKAKVAGD